MRAIVGPVGNGEVLANNGRGCADGSYRLQ